MQSRIIIIIILMGVSFFSIPLELEAHPRDSLNLKYEYKTKKAIPDILAIGDIDNDDKEEILFASTDSNLVLLHHNFDQGPIKRTKGLVKKILISDLDGDSYDEIIAIDSKTLYILTKDLKSEFEYDFEVETSDIALGNLDDDELDELLVGTDDGIHAFDYCELPNQNECPYKELWSYSEHKLISRILCLSARKNHPFIIVENDTNLFALTYNGEGPLWIKEFEKIFRIGYIENQVVVLGKKSNDLRASLWKFLISDGTEENFFTQKTIYDVFFAHYDASDLLAVSVPGSLISIGFDGEENWNLPICPISVELFDLDGFNDFPPYDCLNSEYDETIIVSERKIQVYIDCWEKGESGRYKAEMRLIEEYGITEDIRAAKVFESAEHWEKYVLIVTDEGKLKLYDIFSSYNWFVYFYEKAMNELDKTEVDFNQALDDINYCIKRPVIAEHYGMIDFLNNRRQECLSQLGIDESRIDQIVKTGLEGFEEKNYIAAAENLSKVYLFYYWMNTDDNEIIYEEFKFSEIRSIIRYIMAELAIKAEYYYSTQDYRLALRYLSHLEKAFIDTELGIDEEEIPESSARYNFRNERQGIADDCSNQLKKETESLEQDNRYKDALEIWQEIKDAYLRMGYSENHDIVVTASEKIENIQIKINQGNQGCIIACVMTSVVIIIIYFIKFDKGKVRTQLREVLSLSGKEISFSSVRDENLGEIAQEEVQNEMTDFENFMRKFIENELKRKYSKKWWKQGIPKDVRDGCKERKEADKKHFWKKHDEKLLWYSNFDDLSKIIIRKDNWREIFSRYFSDKTNIKVKMNELKVLRDSLMHGRRLAENEKSKVKIYIDEIRGSIERSVSSQ